MDYDSGDHPKAALIVYRFLAAIAIVIAAVIVAGTAISFATKKSEPKTAAGTSPEKTSAIATGLPQAAGSPDEAASGQSLPADAYFTGIGKIRASSAGKKPATIIVAIAFPYDRGDIAFSEELASRTKEFREIAKAYFGSRTPEDLRKAPEPELKEELRKRYNALLRLGKIKTIYFNDYLLID